MTDTDMIRSAFIALALTVVTIVVGLPLFVYAMISGNANPLYRAGVAVTVWTCRVAGMRTRVEGLENIPPGACLFAANHTSNADGPAIVGAVPRRIAILAKKSLFAIPIVGTGVSHRAFRPRGSLQCRTGPRRHRRGRHAHEKRRCRF